MSGLRRKGTRPHLLRAAAASTPAPTPAELAAYWEHCTNLLALRAIDVQAAWLEVLGLLEARAVLVVGNNPPEAIARMDLAVRALSKGPVE